MGGGGIACNVTTAGLRWLLSRYRFCCGGRTTRSLDPAYVVRIKQLLDAIHCLS